MKVELWEYRDVGEHHHHHDQVEVEREVPGVRKLQSEHLGLGDSEKRQTFKAELSVGPWPDVSNG